MARKPTVDVVKVIEMLRSGQSTQAVADRFGVSRQAIDLHRRKFIQSGELEEKRAGKVSAPSSGYDASRRPPKAESVPAIPLDRLIELVIEAFDSLKRVRGLETELERYKRDYERALGRVEQLEKEVNRRLEQEARWRQTAPSDISR